MELIRHHRRQPLDMQVYLWLEKGYTQREVAEHYGVTQAAVTQWLQRRKQKKIRNINYSPHARRGRV